MSALAIFTLDDRTAYRPGDEVIGTAGWDLDRPPGSAEVRLFWYTRGKGDRDLKVIACETFDAPLQQDQRDFRFRLPDRPYSFSGKLISLIWALELVITPGNESRQLEIVVSPTGAEVDLLTEPGAST